MTTVFLSRKEYDATLPWSPKAVVLVQTAKKAASLAGFQYTFADVETAKAFKAEIGK